MITTVKSTLLGDAAVEECGTMLRAVLGTSQKAVSPSAVLDSTFFDPVTEVNVELEPPTDAAPCHQAHISLVSNTNVEATQQSRLATAMPTASTGLSRWKNPHSDEIAGSATVSPSAPAPQQVEEGTNGKKRGLKAIIGKSLAQHTTVHDSRETCCATNVELSVKTAFLEAERKVMQLNLHTRMLPLSVHTDLVNLACER